ncbi:MAG: CDP-diacylglycerol--glycerol-3-phosphate 3-phosphatidyltransferase [Myxococcales bacterium]|nr:CDP-diacylglycerol--glycerol-3-phosphate 3-phosphatidyltransferase [Myxococcales bacterium]
MTTDTKPASKRPRPSPLREELLNLPNMLTMARVAIIPVVFVLMDLSDPLAHGAWDARWAAFWTALLFFGASVTDFLDGWLARKLGLESMFGRFMDPLADKLLVMVTLLQLVRLDRAPAWLVALLLSREIGITGLRAIAMEEGMHLPSDRFGKWKTALQMTGLGGLLVHFPVDTNFGIFRAVIDYHRVGLALLVVSMVFSLLSAGGYMMKFVAGAFGVQRARRKEDVA